MSLLTLPNESVLDVTDHLQQKDKLCLMSVNHRLHSLLKDRILFHNVQYEDCKAFTWAIRKENLSLVRHLLRPHINVNRGISVKSEIMGYKRVTSLLHLATIQQNLEIITMLLDAGADVKARDWKGRLPLFWALISQDPGIIAAVSSRMGRMTKCIIHFDRKTTPLHLIGLSGSLDLMHHYVAAGVDINAYDTNGWTALRYAKLAIYHGYWGFTKDKPSDEDQAAQALILLGESSNRAHLFAALRDYRASEARLTSSPAQLLYNYKQMTTSLSILRQRQVDEYDNLVSILAERWESDLNSDASFPRLSEEHARYLHLDEHWSVDKVEALMERLLLAKSSREVERRRPAQSHSPLDPFPSLPTQKLESSTGYLTTESPWCPNKSQLLMSELHRAHQGKKHALPSTLRKPDKQETFPSLPRKQDNISTSGCVNPPSISFAQVVRSPNTARGITGPKEVDVAPSQSVSSTKRKGKKTWHPLI